VLALFHDLRYALRQLRKTPGMAVLAVLTLALGIGANTAIFTVIESVLLRPLPYSHSDRLVYVGAGVDKSSFSSTSWLNYRDIHTQSTVLQDAAGYTEDVSVLETRDGSQKHSGTARNQRSFRHNLLTEKERAVPSLIVCAKSSARISSIRTLLSHTQLISAP